MNERDHNVEARKAAFDLLRRSRRNGSRIAAMSLALDAEARQIMGNYAIDQTDDFSDIEEPTND